MSQRFERSGCLAGPTAVRGIFLAAAVALAAGCEGGEGRQATHSKSVETESAEVVGTFTPGAPIESQSEGRLPAEGDLSAYIAATALFPGSGRIDPAIRNPASGDPNAVAAGERHFAAFNCAGCHAPLGGGGMGPPLSDQVWIYGSEPAQIYLSILHGRPEGMPAWGSMLPRRTIWELVAYVETLPDVQDPAAELGFDSLAVRESRTQAGATDAGQQ